jgi:hypothetical protein
LPLLAVDFIALGFPPLPEFFKPPLGAVASFSFAVLVVLGSIVGDVWSLVLFRGGILLISQWSLEYQSRQLHIVSEEGHAKKFAS